MKQFVSIFLICPSLSPDLSSGFICINSFCLLSLLMLFPLLPSPHAQVPFPCYFPFFVCPLPCPMRVVFVLSQPGVSFTYSIGQCGFTKEPAGFY